MQSRIVVNSQEESLLSTHKVLRNTYFLLGLTMAFSAVVAYISMSLNLPYPNLIVLHDVIRTLYMGYKKK